jgi:cytochrome P450
VIAMRRAEPRNDLISNFALAEIDGDRLDDREVLLTTTTLIMAGVESLGGFMMMFAYNLASFDEARRAWWPTRPCCPTRSRSRCATTPRPSASAAA